MSYSEFTLETIEKKLGITWSEKTGIFAQCPEVAYSDFLAKIIETWVPLALAIDTEKSRSELIVSPILLELKSQLHDKISLFSGKDFTVAPEKGLNGRCDFLISQSPEQLIIKAPVIAIVEAKNDNLQSGLGQCMAEMVAAQLFNQRQENEISTVYGIVTTGSLWKFLKLQGQEVAIDLNEYFLNPVGKILGILSSFINS